MSTYLRAPRRNYFITPDQLQHYFEAFFKPASEHVLGIEWELFGVSPESGKAIPYSGEAGVESVLKLLSRKFGYDFLQENDHWTALFRGENFVALEPGGQFELSAEPVQNVHEVVNQLESFRAELRQVAAELPVAWIAAAFHPFSGPEEIEWVPKKRYLIMRDYLARKGSRAHDMMQRTAANQISIDFSDEADAMEKLRVIFGITSLVSALFANSPLAEGKPNGYLTRRMASWRETDPDRTGIIPVFLRESAGFKDYLNYVMDAPMIFIIRNNQWIAMEGVPFRSFLLKGHGEFQATRDDFDLHLSTLFPEARVKNCIEIRGADGQRFPLIPAVPALWKGLLYNSAARQEVWRLVKDFTPEERAAFHREMELKGPAAFMGKRRGWDLVKEIVALSRQGLKEQAVLDRSGRDESVYLDPLIESVVLREKTPAEDLLEKWEGDFRGEARALIDYLKIDGEKP